MVDTFNIHSNCSVVLVHCFSLNGVICCVTAWAFWSRSKIARWHYCNADNFKTLKANHMLVRLLYAYWMTKYVGEISLWNSWRFLRKLLKNLRALLFCRTLYMYIILCIKTFADFISFVHWLILCYKCVLTSLLTYSLRMLSCSEQTFAQRQRSTCLSAATSAHEDFLFCAYKYPCYYYYYHYTVLYTFTYTE